MIGKYCIRSRSRNTAEEAAARDAVVARGAELNEWLISNYTPKKQVEYKRVLVAWLSK